jgi:hypothetical protein
VLLNWYLIKDPKEQELVLEKLGAVDTKEDEVEEVGEVDEVVASVMEEARRYVRSVFLL